jgi:hypothetical protein
VHAHFGVINAAALRARIDLLRATTERAAAPPMAVVPFALAAPRAAAAPATR